MDIRLLFPMVVSLSLHMLRTGAFMAVVPFFGRNRDSKILRLLLAISSGAIFWWIGDMTVPMPNSMLGLAAMAVREAVVGFALGFALSAILSMMTIAGEVISMEMGFSMARSINPETGRNSTVVSQLLQVFGMLLVLSLDLHHEALRIMQQTFEVCPVGQEFDFAPLWLGVRDLVGGAIQLAIRLALPIMGLMFLVSTGTVLIGRAIPTINMMEFAFSLRVLGALGVLGFYIVQAMPYITAAFEGMFERTWEMFGG